MLLTRAPLYRGRSPFSFDLHVLSAPLTFVLSQDQTLQLNSGRAARRPRLCDLAVTSSRVVDSDLCLESHFGSTSDRGDPSGLALSVEPTSVEVSVRFSFQGPRQLSRFQDPLLAGRGFLLPPRCAVKKFFLLFWLPEGRFRFLRFGRATSIFAVPTRQRLFWGRFSKAEVPGGAISGSGNLGPRRRGVKKFVEVRRARGRSPLFGVAAGRSRSAGVLLLRRRWEDPHV